MCALNFLGRSKTRQSTILIAFVLVFGFCLTSDLYGQGKLGRVRETVRRHETPPSETTHHHQDNNSNEEKHRNHRSPQPCYGGGASLGSVFMTTPLFNNHRPQRIVHEHIHVVEPAPLALTEPGDQTYFDQDVSDSIMLSQRPIVRPWENYFKTWSKRLSATYGSDFDEIAQGYFGLLLQSPGGFGLDSSVMMLRENSATFRDHLWIGDVNLVYEVINSSDFRARIGVGINWLGDSYGGDSGANLTSGFDWQLSPKWILTGETDFGNLGDSDLFRGELSIGRQFNNAEWTTGYRHTDIGGTSLGSVFTGFRFRF